MEAMEAMEGREVMDGRAGRAGIILLIIQFFFYCGHFVSVSSCICVLKSFWMSFVLFFRFPFGYITSKRTVETNAKKTEGEKERDDEGKN